MRIDCFKLLLINKTAPCDSTPCQNNGICSNTDSNPFFSCDCTMTNGYTGNLCERGKQIIASLKKTNS